MEERRHGNTERQTNRRIDRKKVYQISIEIFSKNFMLSQPQHLLNWYRKLGLRLKLKVENFFKNFFRILSFLQKIQKIVIFDSGGSNTTLFDSHSLPPKSNIHGNNISYNDLDHLQIFAPTKHSLP